MPIPRGTECYNVDCSPVAARGLAYSEDELETALSGPVSAILRDDAGNEVIYELLTGVAETDFQDVLTVAFSGLDSFVCFRNMSTKQRCSPH